MNFNFKGEVPENVSVENNAIFVSSIRSILVAQKKFSHNIFPEKHVSATTFYELVKSGGPMDYKLRDTTSKAEGRSSKYENFGNYNYGVVAQAMGIDENFAKAAAGAQQVVKIMEQALKKGKSYFDDMSNDMPADGGESDKDKYKKYYEAAKEIKKNNPKKFSAALFQYFLNEGMRIGRETGNYGYLDDQKDQKFISDGYRDAREAGYGISYDSITFDDFIALNIIGEWFFDLDDTNRIEKYSDKTTLSISNPIVYDQVDEYAVFKITLSKPLSQDLKLKVTTIDDTAKSPSDYEAKSKDEITIKAGQTSYDYKVKVVRDGIYEGKEVFGLYVDPIDTELASAIGINDIHMAYATLIDFPEDRCPQPTHNNFDLSFNLPSSTSYGVGAGAGGSGGGAGGSASWGIGSTPSISISSKKPTPDIPYVECPDEPELNSMLTAKIPQAVNNTAPANSNPLNSQAANENDNSDSCSDGMCVPNRSEQNPGSGNKDKAGFASNANNANSKQSGAALNLSGTTDTDKSGNKLYFDMNSDGFKERMLDWFGQDEGVLVNDTNRNGIVDNGSEIIGNRYLNSKGETTLDTLSLLRDFDTNKDGVIDSKDNSSLSIWIDKNRNAKTDEGELISINDANSPIKSISLNYLDTLLSGYDRNHDMKIDKSDKIYDYIYIKNNDDNSINLYIYGDDRARAFLGDKTKDLTLQTDQGLKRVKEVIFYKDVKELNLDKQKPEYSDPRSINLVSDAAPWDLNGIRYSSEVNLKESEYDTLGNTLYTYERGSGKVNIYDWNGIDTLKFGEGISRENLIIEKTNESIKIYVKNGIATKDEDLSKITDVITINFGVDYAVAGDAPVATSEAIASENNNIANNAAYLSAGTNSRRKRAISEPAQTTGIVENIVLSDGNRLNLDFLYNGTDKSDLIVCGDDSRKINAGDGNDIIVCGDGDYEIGAGDGDDMISVGSGYNIIDAGKGDDYFKSDSRSSSFNVFKFGRGDGKDIIIGHKVWRSWRGYAYTNIEFKEGITTDDIIIRKNHDLFDWISYEIALKEEGKSFDELSDKIYIKGGSRLQLIFQDGTDWDDKEIYNRAQENKVIHNSLNAFVLDLNNNGITSISPSDDSSPKFNINGEIKRSGWIERGDGLLAMDLNRDGYIDPTTELIGEKFEGWGNNDYINRGLAVLKKFDSDNNGILDEKDDKFNEILVWQDNGDGISQRSEIKTLKELGIDSIYAGDTRENRRQENDNLVIGDATFSQDGVTKGFKRLYFRQIGEDEILPDHGNEDHSGPVVPNPTPKNGIKSLSNAGIERIDIRSGYTGSGGAKIGANDGELSFENRWFKSDTLDTIYERKDAEQGGDLSSLAGSGKVRSLNDAMAGDDGLKQSVQEYRAGAVDKAFDELSSDMDKILDKWALNDNFGSQDLSLPPVVLDLNGNGITSTPLDNSQAYFDYINDGRRNKTAWIEKGDGILAVDINKDGIINNSFELFGSNSKLKNGTYAKDGVQALKDFDSDNNGVIDERDERFGELLLWQDNGDGKCGKDEVKSLKELGISSISLKTTEDTQSENGNKITASGEFRRSDGSSGIVRDVWFETSKKQSIALSDLDDETEKKISVVEAFRGARLSAEQRANPYIITAVLKEYENIKFDSISKILANKLFGEDAKSCALMFNALNLKLARIISGEANASETALAINLLASVLKRDYNYALFKLNKSYLSNDKISSLLAKTGIKFSLSGNEITGVIGKHVFGDKTSETFDYSKERSGVIISSKEGNDLVVGSDFNDEIYGGAGNDILMSGSGIDILNGGAGNDLLIGSKDRNIYEYYLGDGEDIIYDDGGADALRFAFLSPEDLKFRREGDDMKISVYNPYNKTEIIGGITIKKGYTEGKIEKFYFDGKVYGFDEFIKEISEAELPQNNPVKFKDKLVNAELNDVRQFVSALEAIDPDGDKLSYEILKDAENGKFRINEYGSYEYIPNDKFIGEDSVKIRVSDGRGSFDESEIKFNVKVSAPDIKSEKFVFDEDTSLTGALEVENKIGGALKFEILTTNENLSTELDDNGMLHVKPALNFNGEQNLKIRVTNEFGLSCEKEIALKINPVNDAPIVEDPNETVTLKNTFSYAGKIAASDVDGDVLRFKLISGGKNLKLNSDGSYLYNSKSAGEEEFKIEVSDGGISVTKTLKFKNLGYVNDGSGNIVIDGKTSDTLNLTTSRAADLKFARSGNDLIINGGRSNTTLKDYFISKDMKLSKILLDGGTEINISNSNLALPSKKWYQFKKTATLKTAGTIVSSGDKNILNGSKQNDTIISLGKFNHINAGKGDDVIFAAEGDIANGEKGNDTLIATANRATLIGSDGDDTYIVSASLDGVVIRDKEYLSLKDGGRDVLKLQGARKDEISFSRNGVFGKDLVLRYAGKSLTIENQFSSKSAVERIELGDGDYITSDKISKIIEDLNSYASDKGFVNFGEDKFRSNEQIAQIYASGWSN